MKEAILKNFSNEYCSIDEIVAFIESRGESTSRKTVIWNVNDLVRQGKAIRVGRGVYGFISKKRFTPVISEETKRVCSLLQKHFKYLVMTVSDSGVLSQFMSLQPFSTVVVIETRKSAASSVLSELRRGGVDAYAKRDYAKLERYVVSSQPFLVRSELAANPSLTQEGNYRSSNLEKMLVDLVCDDDVYGQYQGEELINIYKNATSRYSVNYSQMLKYAAARKKKSIVQKMLQETDEYAKIRSLI